jgi:hypothetical protein
MRLGCQRSVITQSKEELVSALPELAKCTNGVSWLQSEPPILFLEEGNLGMMVSKVESHSLELKMYVNIFQLF